MIRTRLRKIYRDVVTRKGRTALVSVSIFVGVLGVVTLTSVGDVIIRQLRRDLREDELAMVFVFVSLPDDATVDNAAALDTLRAHPGVTAVEGRVRQTVFWKFPQDKGFIEGALRAYSEPFEELRIEPLRLIEGRYPTPGRREFVIERRMADRYGLEAGDDIIVRNLKHLDEHTDPTVPLPEETWRISGIVFHPYIWDGSTALYTNYSDAQTLSDFDGFTAFEARFTSFTAAQAEIDRFGDRIDNQTPYTVEGSELSDPARNDTIEEVGQWVATLTALAVLAMLVSSILVVTVITTIVVEQRRQIGVMKSIGATRLDNSSMYTGLALTYGIIGTIPGVLLGVPAAYGLTRIVAPLINIIVPEFAVSPVGILAGAAMGLTAPVLAALFPVYMGTRVTIFEAMTDLGIGGQYGHGLMARILRRATLLPGIRQAIANLAQKQGRLALTGLTLTLAVGAFMGVSAVFISLDNTIDDIFATYNYDAVAFWDEPKNAGRAAALIGELNGITVVSSGFWAEVGVVSERNATVASTDPSALPPPEEEIFVMGFDPTTDLIRLNLQAGTAWRDDPEREGIVLTQELAERLGKRAGDVLTLTYEGKLLPLEIIGIDKFPFEAAFARWQTLADFVNGPDDPLAPRELFVRLDDRDASAAEVDRRIGEIRETLLQNGIFAGFYNQVADEEENSRLILTVGLVFNIASAVMALVGAIGLLTALSISVFERQREIGVMRSIGAGSRTIAGQFLTEGLLVGLAAWVIGVPVSYGLSQVLLTALPLDDFGFRYPPISLAIGLVGMLVIATLASLWPSLAAARKTVSDILRYQ